MPLLPDVDSPEPACCSNDADERPNAHVAVVSERVWRKHLDARTDAVGQPLALDGIPYRVAAVLPDDFADPIDSKPGKPVFNRKTGDALFIRRKGGPKKVPARPIVPENLPAPIISAWEGKLVEFVESGLV